VANVKIVFPDTSPLISLAKAGLLDVLLAFKPTVRIIVTDAVQTEATEYKEKYADAAILAEWIDSQIKTGRIEVPPTQAGLGLKARIALKKLIAKHPELRGEVNLPDLPIDPASGKKLDPGDASILEAVTNALLNPGQSPTLIITNDADFSKVAIKIAPNSRVVSLRAFIEILESLDLVSDANHLWEMISKAHITTYAGLVDEHTEKTVEKIDVVSEINPSKIPKKIQP
jgi:hypothetical protein